MLYFKTLIDTAFDKVLETAKNHALHQKGDDLHNAFAAEQVKLMERAMMSIKQLELQLVDNHPNWKGYKRTLKLLLSDTLRDGHALLQSSRGSDLNLDFLEKFINGIEDTYDDIDKLFAKAPYKNHRNKQDKAYTSTMKAESSLFNQFIHLSLTYKIDKIVHYKVMKIAESKTYQDKWTELLGTLESWADLLENGSKLNPSTISRLVASSLEELLINEEKLQNQARKGATQEAFRGFFNSIAKKAGYEIGGSLGPMLQEFMERFRRNLPYTPAIHKSDVVRPSEESSITFG
jgi:hypothetical protein